MIPFQLVAAALCRWIRRERDDVIAFLREENRVLKAQLRGRRLRLSDPEQRRLAIRIPREEAHRQGTQYDRA